MKIKHNDIYQSILFEHDLYKDDRGIFLESYNSFVSKKLNCDFIQDNLVLSSNKLTFRGMHFQVFPFDQKKLIRVIKGSIIDILYDLREQSPSFKKIFQIELDDSHKHSLYIPNGVAHGYITLEANTIVQYKVDKKYSPQHEKGINIKNIDFDYQFLNFNYNDLIISDRDKSF